MPSFCSKPKQSVEHLIAGPGVYICNECITLCNEIIADLTQQSNRSND